MDKKLKTLKWVLIVASIFYLALASGCTKDAEEPFAEAKKDFPPPSELYALIEEAAGLPEMARLEDDMYPYVYGIEEEWFEEAVSYSSIDITQPDEIVIIRCKIEEAAEQVLEKLEFRLAYKDKSAQNYLPETIIFIQNGVIRQDELTVSLLVLKEIDAVLTLYDTFR